MPGDLRHDVRRVRTLARLLDSAVRIPIIGVRIGLDPLLGLVPGVGDAVSAVLSGYPLFVAVRHRLPGTLILRMVGNVALDAIVGALPVLGDLFDIAFKANVRNQRILEAYADQPIVAARESRIAVALALAGLALVVAALVAATTAILLVVLRLVTG